MMRVTPRWKLLATRLSAPLLLSALTFIAVPNPVSAQEATPKIVPDVTPEDSSVETDTQEPRELDVIAVEPMNDPRDSLVPLAPADNARGKADASEGVDARNGSSWLESAESPSLPILGPEMLALRDKVRGVLAYHLMRPEAVERRSPWGVMHALIPYGVDAEVTSGGRPVNAIGWLCWNRPSRGQQMMYTRGAQLQTKQGPGVQGHEGQFLAILAQSKVMIDYPLQVDGRNFTVGDLVKHEQDTCRERTELTFKLIGLSHYLDPDATWRNQQGQPWSISKLIQEELAQPINGAACGGTHRLMGYSYAVYRRERTGGAMEGQWLRAKKYLESYHDYTFRLQNRDGSFSTNWFRGPGTMAGMDRRIETTGHILEWMVFSLSDEQLQDPRVVRAVDFLAELMASHPDYDWKIGPRGHALHALAIYDERVFGGRPGHRRVELANWPTADKR